MESILSVNQEALRAQLQRRLEPKYATRLFQLRDIPSVMRSRLGWPVATALMERWFNGAAYEMPPLMKKSRDPYRLNSLASVRLDETTVTMRWAGGFARVQTAIKTLQAKWANPDGVALLKRRINKQGTHQTKQSWRFGDLSQPAKILHETCQVNYLVFGQWSDPMDDFYGAMGEAQLNIAVSGMVRPQGQGKISLEIDEFGFYLRDAYEFNDGEWFVSQPLGFWSFQGVERGIQIRSNVNIEDKLVNESPAAVQSHKYFVQNQGFRHWRKKHHRGGDFMVLSDVLRVRLPHPLKYTL